MRGPADRPPMWTARETSGPATTGGPAGTGAGRRPVRAGGAGFAVAPESGAHRVFRVVRSSTVLIIIALGLGLALAATIGGIVYAIAAALHHAASQ